MSIESGYFPERHDKNLPDGETYFVANAKKILENPKLADKLERAGKLRADDIFENANLKEKIAEDETVLYVGSGTGLLAQKIEKETGSTVIKFDLADLRTPEAKDNKFALANARRLPVKNEVLDTICLFDILHHLKNQEEILRESLRVLKPGGKCLVIEDTIPESIKGEGIKNWIKNKRREIKKLVVAKMDDAFNLQPSQVNPHNYHSISEWKKIFINLGFSIDEKEGKSWYWGAPDIVSWAGRGKPDRLDHGTLLRPFEATVFEIKKPTWKDNEIHF